MRAHGPVGGTRAGAAVRIPTTSLADKVPINALTRQVDPSSHLSGYPTDQDLTEESDRGSLN